MTDGGAGPRIRTPDQRLRVFVSSTLKELEPERRAVRAAIERLELAPVMFELGARPHPPRELYRAYLEQSDVFVAVYWREYGWVAPGEPRPASAPADAHAPFFYVRDDGIGIEPRHHETVFRLYKRLHARDAYGGGTGAGLTIVQRIVERHGGRVWIDSAAGEGTTVWFTLGTGEARRAAG